MPWCLSDFSSSAEISSSSSGTARGSISSTVTLVPKRWKMEANSTPTAPAPIMTIDLGIAGRFRISLLVSRVLPSASRPGSMRASEPVASTIFFAVISCVAPWGSVTLILPGPEILPRPRIMSTLFFFSRNSTPLASLVTTLVLRARMAGQSTATSFATMPNSLAFRSSRRRRRSAAGPWWECSRRAGKCRPTCRPSQQSRFSGPTGRRGSPPRIRRGRCQSPPGRIGSFCQDRTSK